jgi:hypothetical protein
VIDTIALLEQAMTPEQYQHQWVETRGTDGHSTAPRVAGT